MPKARELVRPDILAAFLLSEDALSTTTPGSLGPAVQVRPSDDLSFSNGGIGNKDRADFITFAQQRKGYGVE